MQLLQIPLLQLWKYLQSKGVDYGVEVHDVDESYTSKTSALSGNVVAVQSKASAKQAILTNDLKGSRVKRGLFKDKQMGHYVNADLNAAANIAKIGSGDDIIWIRENLFKLCNPVKVKSDRDLLCLMRSNTDSDKTSPRWK